MKKSGLLLTVLLTLATIGVSLFGASMMAQDEENLLLFSYYNEEANSHSLYMLNADTGEERFISELIGYADAGWSPDGNIWIVDDDMNERRLRFFNTETLEESNFEHSLYIDFCAPNIYWSPNGEQMAYKSSTGAEFFLNVQNLADGSSYQIPIVEYGIDPRWSPDSQYLLVAASALQIYRASDGSLLLSASSFSDFSPDSRHIAYSDGNSYLYELATGESIELGSSYPIWSPSGRYFMTSSPEGPNLHDTQTEAFQTLDLGFPIRFEAWSSDESAVFLRSDFVQYEGLEGNFATSLLLYNLNNQSRTVILENTAWIGRVHRNGDWYAISYGTIPPEPPYSQPDKMLFYDGTNHIEMDLGMADLGPFWTNLSTVGDGLGFAIYAEDGLYYFDNATASLELISPDNSYQFVSPDGDYIAFESPDENGNFRNISIWNREDRSIRLAEQRRNTLIGWRGSSERRSLLYCGIG